MESDLLTSAFVRLRERLRRYSYAITGDADEADDALSDAFERLWGRYAPSTEVDAEKLTYRAVRNASVSVVRRRRSHPGFSIETLEEPEDEPAEEEDTYERVIALAERGLTERQYEVFRLHDLEGRGYAETAELTGLTQENVRAALSRARKRIRELYNSRL